MTTRSERFVRQAIAALEEAVVIEREEGAKAVEAGDYSAAKRAIRSAERLQEAIDSLTAQTDTKPVVQRTESRPRKRPRRDFGRIDPGQKSPPELFEIPILRALETMGGSGRVADVLDRVGAIVQGQLKPVDLDRLPSNDRQPRWRNTAQWSRLDMVKEGLLRADSPKGVWEITEQGRARLRRGAHG